MIKIYLKNLRIKYRYFISIYNIQVDKQLDILQINSILILLNIQYIFCLTAKSMAIMRKKGQISKAKLRGNKKSYFNNTTRKVQRRIINKIGVITYRNIYLRATAKDLDKCVI